MKRALLVLLFSTLSCFAQSTITGNSKIVGNSTIPFGPQTSAFTLVQHTFCSVSLTGTNPYTCTIPATGVGNEITVLGVALQGSTSTLSISGVSDSGSDVYTHRTATNLTIINSSASAYFTIDSWDTFSSASSVTSVVVTWSGTPTNGQAIEVVETSRTIGLWSLDEATSASNTSCTVCSGAPLTGLIGARDFLLMAAEGNGLSSAPTVSGGGWTVLDAHTADFVTSQVTVIFAVWNGSATASPTNAQITVTTADTMPVLSLAYK
jgi:hypothetical protein